MDEQALGKRLGNWSKNLTSFGRIFGGAVTGGVEILEGALGTNVYGEKLDTVDRILSIASGAASIGANVGLAGIKPRQKMVTIYRAVNPEELKSIQNTGTFINPNGLEGKYFTTSSDAASDYARQAVKAFGDEPYTIIRTQVPRECLESTRDLCDSRWWNSCICDS